MVAPSPHAKLYPRECFIVHFRYPSRWPESRHQPRRSFTASAANPSFRCIVARVKLDCETIIGIGTERPGIRRGASWDLHYVYIPTLDDEFRDNALKMSEELGYFSAPRVTGVHDDEYPGHCPGGDAPEVGALVTPASGASSEPKK
jgi:hypothetical protein